MNEGLAAKAPTDAEAAAFQPVPNPGIRFQANEAQATTAPWIDSNAWRFQRGIRKANYTKLPQGSAPLAAAEAFAFHVDAILNPEQADVPELGQIPSLSEDQRAAAATRNGKYRNRGRSFTRHG